MREAVGSARIYPCEASHKGYNVPHIIYDRQQIYNMYSIGFGAEGAKMPVYVEECGVERQVALTENVTTESRRMFLLVLYDQENVVGIFEQ